LKAALVGTLIVVSVVVTVVVTVTVAAKSADNDELPAKSERELIL
jgi:hypothetical protein